MNRIRTFSLLSLLKSQYECPPSNWDTWSFTLIKITHYNAITISAIAYISMLTSFVSHETSERIIFTKPLQAKSYESKMSKT